MKDKLKVLKIAFPYTIPIYALVLAVVVNARHIFYGISMLEKFKGTGKKKFYLIYGMYGIICYNGSS